MRCFGNASICGVEPLTPFMDFYKISSCRVCNCTPKIACDLSDFLNKHPLECVLLHTLRGYITYSA